MKHFICFSLTLVFIVLVIACKENGTSANTVSQLTGYWKLQSGLRDKVATETLDGTWVKIDPQSQFSTNLPIADREPVAFEIKKSKLVTKGASKIEYAVTNLTDTSMTLSFSAKGFDFDLNMIKSTPDSTETNL